MLASLLLLFSFSYYVDNGLFERCHFWCQYHRVTKISFCYFGVTLTDRHSMTVSDLNAHTFYSLGAAISIFD